MIIGIYAPNEKRARFYKGLEEILIQYIGEKLILMGDLNGVFNPELDRSAGWNKGKGGGTSVPFHSYDRTPRFN